MQFGLLRLEERRVLTVNATLAGLGDLLDVQLEGANESVTLSINHANQIELRDSADNPVLIDGNASVAESAVESLRIVGDESGGQHVSLESPAHQSLNLADGAQVAGVDDLAVRLDLSTGSTFEFNIENELTIGGHIAANAIVTTSADVAIASGGLLSAPQLHLQPQAGIDVGVGTGASGAWSLDTGELTAGIESNGLLRIGRVGGSEHVNIRDADLALEGYALEVHGGAIAFGGEGMPRPPWFADNSVTNAGVLDGIYIPGGFNNIIRTRCYLGDTDFDVGDGSGDTAAWEFSGLEDGQYLVSVTWCSVGSRATDAPFTISGTGVDPAIVRLDQSGTPNDLHEDGVDWEELSVVNVTGGMGAGELRIALGDDANGYVLADGVRLSRAEPLTPQGPDLNLGSRSVHLIAQESITDLADGNAESLDIVAGALVLESQLGVGVDGNGALDTRVETLAATAAVGGGVFVQEETDLTIGGMTPALRAAGPIEIRAAGNLQVAEAVQATANDQVLLQSTSGDLVVDAAVTANGGELRLSAAEGAIYGNGSIVNPAGPAIFDGQSIGNGGPLAVNVDAISAEATAGGVFVSTSQSLQLLQVAATDTIQFDAAADLRVTGPIESQNGEVQLDAGGVMIVEASVEGAALQMQAGLDLEVHEPLHSTQADISLAAGRDVGIHAPLNAAGNLSLAAGRHLLLDDAGAEAAGAINGSAGSSTANGGIQMLGAAELRSSNSPIQLVADGNVRLVSVKTSSLDAGAVRIESISGSIVDADDGLPAIEASGVQLVSAAGIHLQSDASQPLTLDADSLAIQLLGGNAFVADVNSVTLRQLEAAASEDATVQAVERLTVSSTGSVNASTGSVVLRSLTDNVEVYGDVTVEQGDLTMHAAADAIGDAAINAMGLDIDSSALTLTNASTVDAFTVDIDTSGLLQINGQMDATGRATLSSQSSLILDGMIHSEEIRLAAMDVVASAGTTRADTLYRSQSGGGYIMSASGLVEAGAIEVGAGGDVVITRLTATSEADAAIRIDAGGSINDLGNVVSLQSGGADLRAGAGIGNSGELTVDVDRLRLENQAGEVRVFDTNALEVLSAEQRAGADLTLIAAGPLAARGEVSSHSGRANLISEFDQVEISGEVFGSERLVATAAGDVVLGPNARLTSQNGDIGVIADLHQTTGGRLLMESSSVIASDTGLVALRASGDIVIGAVSSGRNGAAIRVESTSGGILDGGDMAPDISAPLGGLQLLAQAGVGVDDALEVNVARLAAAAEGGLRLHSPTALTLGDVGSLSGVTVSGDTSIEAEQLINQANIAVEGSLTLVGHSLLVSQRAITTSGSDGDLSLRGQAIELLEDESGAAELQAFGDGVIRVDAGDSLSLAPGVTVATPTGRFQDLPISPGENFDIEILAEGGASPIDENGIARASVSVGQAGDSNYLLDVAWSDGVNEQRLGVPGGSSEVSHGFADAVNTVTVTVAVGLDPRLTPEGTVIEHVQLFVQGEPLRPMLTATQSAFGLGLDNILLTFESEVEPVVERPQASEPPLLIQSANREGLTDSLPVSRGRFQEQSRTEDRVLLRVVDDLELDRQLAEKDEVTLEFSDLESLQQLPRKYGLPDGHYRIYFQERGAARLRLLFDIHVVGGEVAPANFREGATERPPQQPAAPAKEDDGAADAIEPTSAARQADIESNGSDGSHEISPDMLDAARTTSTTSTTNIASSTAGGLLALARLRRCQPAAYSKAARLARRVQRASTGRDKLVNDSTEINVKEL